MSVALQGAPTLAPALKAPTSHGGLPRLRPRYVSSWSPALRHGTASASRRSSHPSVIRCPTSSQRDHYSRRRLLLPRPRPSRHLLSSTNNAVLRAAPAGINIATEGPTMKNMPPSLGHLSRPPLLLCSVGAAQVITGSVQLSQDYAWVSCPDAAATTISKTSPLAVQSTRPAPPNRLGAACVITANSTRLQRSSNCLYRSCGYHLQPTIRHSHAVLHPLPTQLRSRNCLCNHTVSPSRQY